MDVSWQRQQSFLGRMAGPACCPLVQGWIDSPATYPLSLSLSPDPNNAAAPEDGAKGEDFVRVGVFSRDRSSWPSSFRAESQRNNRAGCRIFERESTCPGGLQFRVPGSRLRVVV